MKTPQQARILLGITGSIAAYKAADLIRSLQQTGATVRVVMTEAAQALLPPMTLQALSGHPVYTDLFAAQSSAAMDHIALARWPDQVLIAPASANCMAKLAAGIADDLLTTLCLATTAPLWIAPAMNKQMWEHPITQRNKETLCATGIQIIGPSFGEQACGELGLGCLSPPEYIIQALQQSSSTGRKLAGVRVLVTAGPTREPIDPARYLTNRSSGKMGYAIAQAACDAGAVVTLISGPTALSPPPAADYIAVETAEKMHSAVMSQLSKTDILISAAAVADYTPINPASQKIKKSAESLTITLTPTVDILADVAQQTTRLFTVGFAAESEKLAEHALKKLHNKRLDMIAANRISMLEEENCFDNNNNALTVFWRDGQLELPLAPKQQLAQQLMVLIAERYLTNHAANIAQPTPDKTPAA